MSLPATVEYFDTLTPVTVDDVKTNITSAPSRSCDLDPLPKDVVPARAPPVCHRNVQQVAEPRCLPQSQRHAIVTPRLKKANADPSDIKNYRPISNLTFMTKVVERLVCRQLVAYLDQRGLLLSLQSADRKHHSTETAVLKVILDILLAADRGDVTLLDLIDLLAAFDTVDHEILINHLQTSFGIRGKVLSWILSFISRRTQTVSFNGKQSTKSVVVCGVPQGSVMGPVMFLLHAADMIEIARRHGITPHSYADDTQLSIHT